MAKEKRIKTQIQIETQKDDTLFKLLDAKIEVPVGLSRQKHTYCNTLLRRAIRRTTYDETCYFV